MQAAEAVDLVLVLAADLGVLPAGGGLVLFRELRCPLVSVPFPGAESDIFIWGWTYHATRHHLGSWLDVQTALDGQVEAISPPQRRPF